ncbi:LexA family transcriptional regulator [Prevotella copri]|jgi:hypothetical protein|uniref:LexA family transcriptional regulator n=1 Tax=Segatella copri TaxID=165179 RepID=A0A6A7VNM9_9BACT|nr:LexA family transcriptional regulator [Segatella copri]MBW0040969.1 hypothetical protein [Segatella copri]MQN64105.1 LexA family transcriptional regulator [Segatella copri]MQO56273.1 LexA family transcriptional regulator [Segatella copri]MQO94300.1 LexA family transcriptional regulator [Segatella copri]
MILDRIKLYIDTKGISIAAFEKSVGMSNASFSKSLKNNGAIGTDKLENILSVYSDISPEWLLTGQGDMLKEEPSLSVSMNPQEGTPYYDVDFLGGFDLQENSQAMVPALNIVANICPRAEMWCNITGHSMEPTISHGDIIALHKCSVEDIQYGEVYAVVLDTFRTVKILRKSSTPGMLKFVPVNKEEFDEQEFSISRILQVYEVVGSIRRFF